MKKSCFTFFVLLVSLISDAQTYNPLIRNTIYWDVMGVDLSTWCGYNRGGRYSFESDTIIAGKTYKTIRKNPIVSLYSGTAVPPGSFCPPFAANTSYSETSFDGYYSVLLREDSVARKVFVYNTTSAADELFYDFNLVAGDTLNSTSASYGSTLIVDSVGTITLLNSAVRKIIYLDNGSNYIESIGGSQGLQFMLSNPGAGFGYGLEPTCFVEGGVSLWGSQCVGIVGVDEHSDNHLLSIFPNPSNGIFNISARETKNMNVEVYNALGIIVYSNQIINGVGVIELTELANGLYFIKVIVDNKTVVIQKIVKE